VRRESLLFKRAGTLLRPLVRLIDSDAKNQQREHRDDGLTLAALVPWANLSLLESILVVQQVCKKDLSAVVLY
jgi:hypothetical protein